MIYSNRAREAASARGFLRDGLVVTEIALTVVLVSGAALFGRSLANLLSIDLGIRTAHVTTAGVLLSRGTPADSRACRAGRSTGSSRRRARCPASSPWGW